MNQAPSSSPPAPRVVITGLGLVSPLGNEADQLFDNLCQRKSGVDRFTAVPTGVLAVNHGAEAKSFTGHIDDYGPLEKPLQRTIRKGAKLMCREIEMGVAAAQRAIHDAGLTPDQRDPLRTGTIFGCDYIMTLPEEFEEGIRRCLDEAGNFHFDRWAEQGLPQVNPLWLLKYLPNMPASHVAIYNDLQGPNNSITLREASAMAALAEAFSTIQRGHADVLIVGATGSRVIPFRALNSVMQEDLAADRDDPSQMCRPFDRGRDGGVLGEGAGALILETREHAAARGATIHAEVIGYGSSAVGPVGDPAAQRQAVANALRGALRGQSDRPLGHLHAHGLGTVDGDIAEAEAIAEVFGPADQAPPVVTAKGHFGNLGAGGGMVETIASLQALQQGHLFPVLNHETPDARCPLRVVTDEATPAGDSFINVNVTPQGQAAAVCIARYDEAATP